jgi:hypothetical protein
MPPWAVSLFHPQNNPDVRMKSTFNTRVWSRAKKVLSEIIRAGHLGHQQVQDHGIGVTGEIEFKPLFGARRIDNGKPLVLHVFSDDHAKRVFIVNEENCLWFNARGHAGILLHFPQSSLAELL